MSFFFGACAVLLALLAYEVYYWWRTSPGYRAEKSRKSKRGWMRGAFGVFTVAPGNSGFRRFSTSRFNFRPAFGASRLFRVDLRTATVAFRHGLSPQ